MRNFNLPDWEVLVKFSHQAECYADDDNDNDGEMYDYCEAGTLHHLTPVKLFWTWTYRMVKCSYNHFTVTRLSFTEKFRKVLINACDLVTDLIETYSRQNTQNGT